jgi:AcrR family transcriptional regulator
VYRHFPSEQDLFAACSAHYNAMHPWPDPSTWTGFAEGLDQLYRWYEETERMLANVFRDAELVDAVPGAMRPMLDFFDDARRALAKGWPRRKAVAAAIAHATDFRTWRSLVREGGLSRAEAVRLLSAMVERAADQPGAAD